MRLFIAIPCYQGNIHVKTMESVLGLILLCKSKDVPFEFFSQPVDSLISRSRNVCACKFLKSSCTHMLFIDADIIFDPYDVFKLINADKPIIAGVYPKKTLQISDVKEHAYSSETLKELIEKCAHYAVNELSDTDKSTAIREVKFVPTGFLMIQRIAFDTLMDHYPEELQYQNDISAYKSCELNGVMYNFFPTGIKNHRLLSEDYGFCALWTDVGNKLYIDSSIKLTHIGQFYFYGNPQINY